MRKVFLISFGLSAALAAVGLLMGCSSTVYGPSEEELRTASFQSSAAQVYREVQEAVETYSLPPRASLAGSFTPKRGSLLIFTEASGDFPVELTGLVEPGEFVHAAVTGTVEELTVQYTYEVERGKPLYYAGKLIAYDTEILQQDELVTMNKAAFQAYMSSE